MRPSGGPEKAPPLRVPLRVALRTPWLVASPSQPQPHLLLASCSSVLPRGPGTCPFTPWLLPGGDLLLCCPPGGPATLVGGLASRFLGLCGPRGQGWVPCHPVSGTAGPREGVLSKC